MQYPDVVLNYVSKLFNSCSSTFQHFYTVIQDKCRNSNVKHQTNDILSCNTEMFKYNQIWIHEAFNKCPWKYFKLWYSGKQLFKTCFYFTSALYIFNNKHFNPLIKWYTVNVSIVLTAIIKQYFSPFSKSSMYMISVARSDKMIEDEILKIVHEKYMLLQNTKNYWSEKYMLLQNTKNYWSDTKNYWSDREYHFHPPPTLVLEFIFIWTVIKW